MSLATKPYHLRPVSTIAPRDPSPTSSSTTSTDCSPPPLSAHHTQSKAGFLPSNAPAAFSPIPTSARPRRPLSPTSLRDVDPPVDIDRAFAARGKFPAPPTGHELMALFPPAPPLIRPGPTSGYFQREERQFFAQAGKEIVRVRIEIDTSTRTSPVAAAHAHMGPGVSGLTSSPMPPPPLPVQAATGQGGLASPSHMLPHPPHHRAHSQHSQPHLHQHQHPHVHPHAHPHHHERERSHDRRPSGHSPSFPPPPHSTSPRSHLPPHPAPAPPSAYPHSPQGPPPALGGPGAPPHPGYQTHSPASISSRPPERELEPRRGGGGGGGGGGAGDAMVVEDDDEGWRHPTPHHARRRAGKHTRRVIVK